MFIRTLLRTLLQFFFYFILQKIFKRYRWSYRHLPKKSPGMNELIPDPIRSGSVLALLQTRAPIKCLNDNNS